MSKRILTHVELTHAAQVVAQDLVSRALNVKSRTLYVYPVPRGGIPAFYLVSAAFNRDATVHEAGLKLQLVNTPEEADAVIDDLVDSGETRKRLRLRNQNALFYTLISKGSESYPMGEWLVFPWEESEEKSIDDAFTRLLQYVGEDSTRGGLIETPARMAKAWKAWTSGYKVDVHKLLKTFEDGGEHYDEMVHVRDIPFYSHCEHHLAPFFGTVSLAYVPDKKIVGLSKMNRLVDAFARRLQVQERLTSQIIDAFCDELKPLGAGIIIKARHMCVESRGINQQGSSTTTSAFRGVLKDKPEARQEFLLLTQ